MKLGSIWEEITNGKYRRWIGACSDIHFIFEFTENTYTIIVTNDWKKYIKMIQVLYLDADYFRTNFYIE